ncbi:MAG: hypothetical protein AAB272_05200, partial [candidate division NC10 bacterium]
NTAAWDIDIELQNDETIANTVDGTIALTAASTTFSGDITVTGGDITGANSATIDLGEAVSGALTFTAGGAGEFVFDTDADSTLTLNGGGDGVDSLVLTDGDILVSDGDLDVAGGDVNFTTDAGDTLNIAKGAAPTADVVLIAAGSPATTNVDALAITLTTTDQVDITNSLINAVLTSGGTAATDIARGLFLDLASTAGGTDKAIEIENTAAWDIDIELQNDETIANTSDAQFTFGRNDAGTVTITSADNDATAALTIVGGGTTTLSIGDSGDTLAFTGVDMNFAIIDGQTVNLDGDATPTADLVTIGAGDTTATANLDALNITLITAEGADGSTLLNLNPTFAATTASTFNVMNLAAFTATATTNAMTTRGINIGALTETLVTGGTIASTAINVSTGWDTDLNATTSLEMGIGGTNELVLNATNLQPNAN